MPAVEKICKEGRFLLPKFCPRLADPGDFTSSKPKYQYWLTALVFVFDLAEV